MIEIEVKFYISSHAALRSRLKELGAVGHGAVMEKNLRFDNAAGTMHQHGRLLRLRQTDHLALLTVKAPPPVADGRFKIHQEWEVTVDNFECTHHMLTMMGFQVQQVYEKKRETFKWQRVDICLDTMPFGSFLEIEGPKDAIMQAAESLKLNWADRITHNYLQIFDHIRQKAKLTFRDVTFQNFRRLRRDDWTDIIRELQAGGP